MYKLQVAQQEARSVSLEMHDCELLTSDPQGESGSLESPNSHSKGDKIQKFKYSSVRRFY